MRFLNTTANPSLDKELELFERRLLTVEQFVRTQTGEPGTGTVINNTFVTNTGGVTVREVGGTDFPASVIELDPADGYAVSASGTDTARIDRSASLTIPEDVGTADSAGTNTDASNSDHVHEGVHSVSKSGSAQITGDVTLSAGSNVTLTQSGNDIAIASSGGGGGGGVTSVDATVPVEFNVSGVPITTAGTIAITKANEAANRVWAGPTAGAAAQPTFRPLVTGDMPLVAKGQLLTFGAAPALLAVGSNTQVLTADSGVALGVKWAAPVVQQSTMLDGGTVHTDTAAAAVVKGALMMGNASPRWDRLTIGTNGQVLTADSAQPFGARWGTLPTQVSTLLDGVVHTDTAAQGPTKGSLIVGNATPKWDELVVGSNYKILEADAAAANGILWASRGWSHNWSGFTPAATGPDALSQIMVPYHPNDGTRVITWNVRRIWLRVAVAGGAPVIIVQKSSGTGVFTPVTVGTLVMVSGDYEVVETVGLGTVQSGDKIRFSVTTLGTATGWAIGIEMGS